MFRLCVPRAIGGLEAHPRALVEAVEALAEGDAAAGWCVAIGATSGLLSGYLPEAAAREVYGRTDAIAGGVFAPRGRAVVTDAGYRVSGRWPFASGCEHCDWLMGGCLVEDGGRLRTLETGGPDIVLMLAPASETQIHDTWHVAGLRGTGSHDIEFAELAIPREHSASVLSDSPVQPGPLYAFPLFGLLAVAIAGVAVGAARAALDDFRQLAERKTPTGGQRRLAERGTVQADIAQAEAALAGARMLLLDAVERAWELAGARAQMPVRARLSLRLGATHATQTAAAAVATAYRLAGGSAIYERSPLQRRFRDVNAATQHMLVGPATWELTGRLLLGLETDTTQL